MSRSRIKLFRTSLRASLGRNVPKGHVASHFSHYIRGLEIQELEFCGFAATALGVELQAGNS